MTYTALKFLKSKSWRNYNRDLTMQAIQPQITPFTRIGFRVIGAIRGEFDVEIDPPECI
jgi:hypothetical protein